MPVRVVESKQNARLKELRRALAASGRETTGRVGIEGPNLLEEALRAGLRITTVFVAQGSERLLDALPLPPETELLLLPRPLLDSALTTETPQPIAALVEPPDWTWAHLLGTHQGGAALVIVLAAVQDPGNLGTILRSAEAFGAAGIFLTEGTVSPYNSKVLRGSAGSIFRLPLVRIPSAELIPLLRARGVRLLATSSHQGTPLPQISWTLPLAIFIGNEGAGLSRELTRHMDETLAIPQAAQVESLNAGVAASIVLYEAARAGQT